MKKTILAFLIAAGTFTASQATPVSDKVLETFTAAFPNAQDASWSEYGTYAEVYFRNNDNSKCRIRYNNEGKIISTRRDYDGSRLSPFIQSKVKERFGDKAIFGVTEINSEDGLIYHIVLQDSKHWYNVLSDESGQLNMESKLKKSK